MLWISSGFCWTPSHMGKTMDNGQGDSTGRQMSAIRMKLRNSVWYCGTVELWHCGNMRLKLRNSVWYCGLWLWHFGTLALWHFGTVC